MYKRQPLSFLVLVWVFGGLVAAALPLAVGAIAIFGSMAVLRDIIAQRGHGMPSYGR